MSIPACKAILPNLQDYFADRKYCEVADGAEAVYCFYEENITTIDCLSSIPSKYSHLNILC